MLIFILFSLFFLGTLFGSFASVLINRWYNHSSGILTGRSACPKCHHTLQWYDLIPMASFILQKGKCRYCRASIAPTYLILEIITGIVFVFLGWVAYIWQIALFDIAFFTLLFYGFVTIVYAFYDFLYTEIPEQIFILAFLYIILIWTGSYFGIMNHAIPDIHTFPTFHTYAINHVTSAIILYTFVFLQMIIPGGWYLFRKKRYREIGEFFLLYFLFIPYFFWEFFKKIYLTIKKQPYSQNIEASDIPTWIGAGDLIIAVFIGLTLGTTHGISSFFLAYLIGSIVGIGVLAVSKKDTKGAMHEVPLGPFLAIGWLISIIFYERIDSIIFGFFPTI